MIGGSPISQDGGAILGAAVWLDELIRSPAVTGVAILAIAATGLSMLSGRIPVRRGLTVALGCFILFGAPAIARGIVGSVTAIGGTEAAPLPPQTPSQPAPVFNAQPPPTPPSVADPYAGASVQ